MRARSVVAVLRRHGWIALLALLAAAAPLLADLVGSLATGRTSPPAVLGRDAVVVHGRAHEAPSPADAAERRVAPAVEPPRAPERVVERIELRVERDGRRVRVGYRIDG